MVVRYWEEASALVHESHSQQLSVGASEAKSVGICHADEALSGVKVVTLLTLDVVDARVYRSTEPLNYRPQSLNDTDSWGNHLS